MPNKFTFQAILVLILVAFSSQMADARRLNTSISTADEMSRAVYNNNLGKILTLADNFDVNTLNSSGNNALHLAAAHGNLPISSALIGKGANPNVTNRTGLTALDISIIYNRGFVFELLEPITTRKKKVSLNTQHASNNTFIHSDGYEITTLSSNVMDSFVSPSQVFGNGYASNGYAPVPVPAPTVNTNYNINDLPEPPAQYQANTYLEPTYQQPVAVQEPTLQAPAIAPSFAPQPEYSNPFAAAAPKNINILLEQNAAQNLPQNVAASTQVQNLQAPQGYLPDPLIENVELPQINTAPQFVGKYEVYGESTLNAQYANQYGNQPQNLLQNQQPVASSTLPNSVFPQGNTIAEPVFNNYFDTAAQREQLVSLESINQYQRSPQAFIRRKEREEKRKDGGFAYLKWGGLGALGVGALIGLASVATSSDDGGSSSSGSTGGGTGGGDTGSSNFTQEFNQSNFLSQINANSAYSKNITGQGVKVAVIDSGVDSTHSEFSGRVLDTDLNTFGDSETHGTAVAGIVGANRNGIGIHGVAYNAEIIPIQIDLNGLGGQNSTADAFTGAVTKGAKIINNSYSFGDVLDPNDPGQTVAAAQFFSDEIELWQSITNLSNPNRAIVVFSAGNSSGVTVVNEVELEAGLPYLFPSLKDLWVAAYSVDSNNNISNFSNRCGAAAEWCIGAPGENLRTTTTNNGYAFESGTSFSAPVVSGSLALIMEAYPNVTPEAAVEILFVSATDLGEPGIDAVYGNGLVNLTAALAPVGNTALATARANSINFASDSVISGSGAIASTLSNQAASFSYTDSYNRPFENNISNFVTSNRNPELFLSSLRRFGNDNQNNVELENLGQVSLSVYDSGKDISQHFENLPGENSEQTVSFKYNNSIALGGQNSLKFGMARNTNLDSFAFSRTNNSLESENLYSQLFDGSSAGLIDAKDFLSFGGAGDIVSAQLTLGKAAFGFDSFSNKNSSLSDNEHSKFASYASYNFDGGTAIKFSLGTATEEESIFDNSFEGAFNIGNETETYFTTIGLSQNITKDTSFGLQAAFGLTTGKNISDSLFTKHSDIYTNSFEANMLSKNLFSNNDALGLRVFQPMRVLDGSISYEQANLVDAKAVSFDYETKELGLTPDAHELDLEAVYGFDIGSKGKVMANALYRINPNHQANTDNEAAFLLRYKTDF